jgi:hypothetical protein
LIEFVRWAALLLAALAVLSVYWVGQMALLVVPLSGENDWLALARRSFTTTQMKRWLRPLCATYATGLALAFAPFPFLWAFLFFASFLWSGWTITQSVLRARRKKILRFQISM